MDVLWNAVEHGPKSLAEAIQSLGQPGDTLFRGGEERPHRCPALGLDDEAEVLRYGCDPRAYALGGRSLVEGVVELDRAEPGCVEAEPAGIWKTRRVETRSPGGIREAGGAREEPACRRPDAADQVRAGDSAVPAPASS